MSRAALVGYAGIAIVWMTVEAPLEDKGLGLGLAVLLVLATAFPVTQPGRVEKSLLESEPELAAPPPLRVPISA